MESIITTAITPISARIATVSTATNRIKTEGKIITPITTAMKTTAAIAAWTATKWETAWRQQQQHQQ